MDLKQVIKELCFCTGASGCENSVSDYAFRLMEPFGKCYTDKRGNFVCKKPGKGGGFLLDAHMDQIGFAVSSVEDGGFLRLVKVGGIDRRVLPSARVKVLGKREIDGVISSTPPHLAKKEDKNAAPEISDLAVDTGYSAEELKELVAPGDRVVFAPEFSELLDSRVSAVSLDDRLGMLIVARTMEILHNKKSESAVTAVFSVQEETGGGGAGNASYMSECESAFIVDVSFASQPEISSSDKFKTMDLGGGAFIGIYPVLNKKMTDELIAVAKKNNIPYALDVGGGATGTNSEGIVTAASGKRAAMISPPIRNMHTPVEVADLKDAETCARLISSYILETEEK